MRLRWKKCYGEEGFVELLERQDLEAFAVALPSSVQSAYVARILAQRKHVFSEKPVAKDRQAAFETLQRLHADASVKNELVWFISDPLRYEPVFDHLRLRLPELGSIMAAELYGVLVTSSCDMTGCGRGDEQLYIEGGAQQHIALLQQVLGRIAAVNCQRICDAHEQQVRGSVPLGPIPSDTNTPAGLFWKDALAGTLRFDNGSLCALSWQISEFQRDERFRLELWGSTGCSVTIELDSGSQPCAGGLKRYKWRFSTPSDLPGTHASSGQQMLPRSFPSSGGERQLEAWGAAIRAIGEPPCTVPEDDWAATRDRSPLNAIVDLIVVTAMLGSKGVAVQIREKSRPSQ